MAQKVASIWRKIPRWLQAILVGCVVTALFFGLYEMLLWQWPYGGLVGVDRLLLQLALGQVFTGFAAIFITMTLGIFAVWEFIQRQSLPRLEVRFGDPSVDAEAGTRHLDLLKVNGREPNVLQYISEYYSAQLLVYNGGAVTSIWYRLEIRLPFVLPTDDFLDSVMFQAAYQPDAGHYLTIRYEESQEIALIFTSQGTAIAYPGSHVTVCWLRIPKDRAGVATRDYIFPYQLIADGVPEQRGEVRLTLRG